MDIALAKTVIYFVVYLIALFAFFFKIKTATEIQGAKIAELKEALFDKGELRFVTREHYESFNKSQMETICRKLDEIKKANEAALTRLHQRLDRQSELTMEIRERLTAIESGRK